MSLLTYTLGGIAAYVIVCALIGLFALAMCRAAARGEQQVTYARDDGQAWTDADFDAITAMQRGIDLEAAAEYAALEGYEVLLESYSQYVHACLMTQTPAPQMDEFVAMDRLAIRDEADEWALIPDEHVDWFVTADWECALEMRGGAA